MIFDVSTFAFTIVRVCVCVFHASMKFEFFKFDYFSFFKNFARPRIEKKLDDF